MDYKICVYAICKNESKFIPDWLNSMSEADYIVVLDTGSTDNTVEMLKNDERVTRVEQKVIKPWRFDVARNESMKLVPEDADILVCTDFDELFEEGWAKILREHWEPDDDKCIYQYAWSHLADGTPSDIFMYDKIHTKEYHWIFPVHEVLMKNDPDKREKVLDAGDAIFLHHFRDTSKPRSYYFDLLKLSVKENPKESHCCELLAREYYINEDIENAYKYYKKCLDYEDIDKPERQLTKYEAYMRLGDLSWVKLNYDEAMKWYSKAIVMDSTYREPYLCIADMCIHLGMNEMAESILNTLPKITHQHFDWVERNGSYTFKLEHILGLAQFNLGRYADAADNFRHTLKYIPDNTEVKDKYIICLEKMMYGE